MKNEQKIRTLLSLFMEIKNHEISFDHAIQRNAEQWNIKQQSDLLDSIFEGIAIPSITIYEDNNGIKWVIDGKQRLTTLYKFYSGELKLKVNGHKKAFNKLSKDAQDKILSTEINTVIYRDLTEEEVSKIFLRLNSGTALATPELLKSYQSFDMLYKVKTLASHPFLMSKCKLTAAQLKKAESETIIWQTMMLISGEEIKGFTNKHIREFIVSMKDNPERFNELCSTIQDLLNKTNDYITEKYKNLKKVNIPFILATYKGNKKYQNRVIKFLNNYENETEYKQYVEKATSQKNSVLGRVEFFSSF